VCGRYSNALEFSHIRLVFEARGSTSLQFEPRLNIAPSFRAGHEVPIVIAQPRAAREVHLARFWFVPEHWRKPLEALPPTFNARAETVFEKPLFRGASSSGRCLVPATGWREFRDKQPYHFVPTTPGFLAAPNAFAFAAISNEHLAADGSSFRSFAILTREPTAEAALIHERMPLLVPPHLYQEWLSSTSGEEVLAEAMAAADGLELSYFPSDPSANSPRYEGPLAVSPRPHAELIAAPKAKPDVQSPQLALFAADAAQGSAAPEDSRRTRRKS